jgi:hypothetical protein
MILDNFIDKQIGQRFLELDAEKESKHVSSGKLSASMLGQPLQWQILKILKIASKPIDEYTLRKFHRGKQIEEWLINEIPDKVETQKFVEYRNVVGYIDLICDTKAWEWNNGIIVAEIKSVNNLKYKRIIKGGADRSHRLQACLYAIAENKDKYSIIYVSTDDLRVQTYIYNTEEDSKEVNDIITRFDSQMGKKEIPTFKAEEDWQKNPTYQNYPEWSNLNQEEINEKVKQLNLFKIGE